MSVFREGMVDLEAKFEPNILNTTVYIISMSLQVSTFAVNYKVGDLLFLRKLEIWKSGIE